MSFVLGTGGTLVQVPGVLQVGAIMSRRLLRSLLKSVESSMMFLMSSDVPGLLRSRVKEAEICRYGVFDEIDVNTETLSIQR